MPDLSFLTHTSVSSGFYILFVFFMPPRVVLSLELAMAQDDGVLLYREILRRFINDVQYRSIQIFTPIFYQIQQEIRDFNTQKVFIRDL